MLHDFVDEISVATSAAPHFLIEMAFGILLQSAVHAIHKGSLAVALRLLTGIELLRLGLCDAGRVIVHRTGLQQVLTCTLIDALGEFRGVENGVEQLTVDFVACLLQCLLQPRALKGGLELQHAIVVVDAVGKPHAAQVFVHRQEVLAVGVVGRLIVGEHMLQHAADGQIDGTILIPQDVASPQRGFGKVEDVAALLGREGIPARHTITQQLHVGELHVSIVERRFF